MLDKIQKYLLLNYPLIWNMKLFPFLLLAILANVIFFALGYSIQTINVFDLGSLSDTHFFVYLLLVIIIILFVILWLVYYAKNNAIKSYYPTSYLKLYFEWILIFVMLFSIFSIPYSFYQGTNYKIKSIASYDETLQAVEVLNMVKILMPSTETKGDYFQQVPTEEIVRHNPQARKGFSNDIVDQYVQDSILENTQYIYYPDYPNFRQFSLLHYYEYYEYYEYSSLYEPNISGIRNMKTVKEWLIEAKTDSIKNLMSAYLDIQQKNKIASDMTLDVWFSKIYTPPTFEVNDAMLFTLKPDYIYDNYQKEDFAIDQLRPFYGKVYTTYDKDNTSIFLLVLYLSLGVSMLVFSYRVTSGKSWLIAMIAIGVLSIIFSFVTSIFSVIFLLKESIVNPFNIYGLLIIIMFIFELFFVIQSKIKRKTDVMINHIIGLLPIIPLIIYGMLITFLGTDDFSIDSSQDRTNFFFFNLILTLITMFALIKYVILRWKGLPEE